MTEPFLGDIGKLSAQVLGRKQVELYIRNYLAREESEDCIE